MADWDSRLNSEINGVKQNKNTLKHYKMQEFPSNKKKTH